MTDICRELCVGIIRIFTLEPCWKSVPFKTNNKGYMLSKVNDSGYNLLYASDDLKNDKEVVIEAVRNEWRALGYASNLMKMDTDVIIQAIRSGCRLIDLSENVYSNRDVILEAVKHEGTALQLAPESIRNDKIVVKEAVRNDGTALQYASKRLKDNQIVVLEAVTKSGKALRYASDALRGTFEVVATAVKEDSTAIKFALNGLKSDREILIIAGLWDEDNKLTRKKSVESNAIDYSLSRGISDDYNNNHAYQQPYSNENIDSGNMREEVMNAKNISVATVQAVAAHPVNDRNMDFNQSNEWSHQPDSNVYAASESDANMEFYRTQSWSHNANHNVYQNTASGLNTDFSRHQSWSPKVSNNVYLKSPPEVESGNYFNGDYQSHLPMQRVKSEPEVLTSRQQSDYRSEKLRMVHEHESYRTNESVEFKMKPPPDTYSNESQTYDADYSRSKMIKTNSVPVISNHAKLPASYAPEKSSSFRNDGYDEVHRYGDKEEEEEDVKQGAKEKYDTENMKEDANIIQNMIKIYQQNNPKEEKVIEKTNQNSFVENEMDIQEEHSEEPPIEDNDDEQEDSDSFSIKKKIVLSTRFSLGGYISNTVKKFAQLLEEHPLFKDYEIYFPNATDKNTCDPRWTDFYHPCRGTFDTCQKEPELKLGIPQEDKCCWRYSFRYQVEHAFILVQVVEYYHGQFWDYGDDGNSHIIGKGQRIETEMAKDAGTKIFRCFQPTHQVNDTWIKEDFGVDDVDHLAEEVKRWLDEDCVNMDECDLEFNYGEDLKCHSLKHRVMYDECMMNECVFFNK